MPLLLGLGAGDVVVQPTLAYPTYAIGAAMVGASVVSSDDPAEWPEETRLIWLNSPSNPDGRVRRCRVRCAAAVARARELGAVIVNDECYAELNWVSGPEATHDARTVHPRPAVHRGLAGPRARRCTR